MPFQPIDITYRRASALLGAPLPHDDNQEEHGSPQADDLRGTYESALDLNDYCIPHPASTFFAKAEGNAMEALGICADDLLVIDRGAEPQNGSLILAILAGEFAVRRLVIEGRRAFFASDLPGFAPLEITPDTDASIWGIVIGIIRRL